MLQSILNRSNESEIQKKIAQLERVHEEAVIRFKTGINVYSTVVSSIRAYVQNSENFPTEIQLQSFVKDLVKEIDFKDSIIVSWVDTNQVFQYVVTPNAIDPNRLKGMSVQSLRPDSEIEMLNNLMTENNIKLYAPINLIEGWAAFPFNFSARNSKDQVLGYIAPVLNVNYLLNYPYKNNEDSLFVHSFTLDNGVDFTREVVYDGTTIYTKKRDAQYYKNFKIDNSKFIYSTINFYGLKLKIGTAFKEETQTTSSFIWLLYLWYATLCGFSLISLLQFIRNNRLNKSVKLAHSQIAIKNKQLEKNIGAIETLIKEIHHRVKNNMQIMSSLMNLQSNNLENKEVKLLLDESKGRIQSMALVHQKLYGNEDLSSVNVKEYIEQLVSYVENTLEVDSIPSKELTVSTDLKLNMDTMIPLGLIINELVTNSYKYAFQKESENWLNIQIIENPKGFQLIYKDSGPGIPENIIPSESGTLGLELIYILTGQLGGEVNYNNESTSTFEILFKKIEKG